MRNAVAPGDIALTFDDGPDPNWTGQILEVLARHRATATFFVQGRAASAFPGLVEAIVAGGHEVGLHCFDHVRHSTMTASEIRADADAGLAVLARLGVSPRAWRTPWGDETEATAAVADDLGLELWGWTHDTHDWRGDQCSRMLEVLGAAGLDDGKVILLHDGLGPGARRTGAEQTLLLTDALLGRAAEAELRPVALSDALTASRR